jgi:nucleoside-diphosphate-sugar epimerase
MTKILLTGATGFVGRHTLAAFSARGVNVVAVTRGAPGEALPGVTWMRGDLTDHADATRLVREADATHLVHLGWRAVHGDIANSVENLDWLVHSLHLARAFVEHGGKRIIGCGSCFEYDWSLGVCKEDVTPIAPATLYGAAKHAFHTALAGYAKQAGFSLGWARCFFIYGADEHPNRLVASVAGALLDGRPAESSHGRQIRDYAHVDDVADGIAMLTLSDAAGAYNIATGQALALKDIINELAAQVGRPDLVRLGARQAQPFEPPIILGDTAKSRAAFGFETKIDLKTGLAQTLAAMRAAKDAA